MYINGHNWKSPNVREQSVSITSRRCDNMLRIVRLPESTGGLFGSDRCVLAISYDPIRKRNRYTRVRVCAFVYGLMVMR